MVSTRSKTAQTHLEDFATTKITSTRKSPKGSSNKHDDADPPKEKSISKKRKVPTPAAEEPTPKRAKTTQGQRADSAQADIIINRAPVLQLWSACVAHHLYPSLPWSTCISAGSAISTICAVAKGRSIGKISESGDSEEKKRKRNEAKKKQSDLEEIHVMHFYLKIKDGLVIVGSDQKGKPANEVALRKKFGDAEYERVKECFEEALASWGEDDEEQIDKEAFQFYEDFRPTVSSGQKGWGRKGALNLDTVKNVIQK
ncbi:hypothetical protein SLS60_009102 [Paraconiothyrium brasiliense]|uniref:Uncharacterized protein n=1 Tax=Paraconiothyrium brasiliense TaxID=300254 RepID=A0ABR3QWC7_9PLEO